MAESGAAFLAAWTAGVCLAAACFLLLGWRLGRESAGKAMFEHGAQDGGRDPEAFGEDDPWEAAMPGPGDDPEKASCGFP